MSIDWLWKSRESAGVEPAIGHQFVRMDSTLLQIRNPWAADSVFMGKLYSSGFIAGVLAIICYLSAAIYGEGNLDFGLLISAMAVLVFIALMLALRIHIIKSRSDFIFNRLTGLVCCRDRKQLISGVWESTVGGLQSKSEFTGRGVSVTHSLVLRMQAESVKIKAADSALVTLFVSIDSNKPIDPHVLYVAQIWEFIHQFMEEGPDKLPAPGEPNWWYIPLHRVCLTPAEAWRHYAPWRTGEPGERQGKKNWLLPMWLLLFPYNLFSALCWYGVCRLFNVRSAPPPAEALRA